MVRIESGSIASNEARASAEHVACFRDVCRRPTATDVDGGQRRALGEHTLHVRHA